MNQEQEVLNAFERGKAFGFAEGMKSIHLKELTEEEIKSEAKYLCHGWHSENPERLVLFARAILRKASEK